MTSTPVRAVNSAGAGSLMAVASMSCVQLGLAASIGLAATLGSDGVAWLRLAWAAVILVAFARPWRLRFSRSTLVMCALLGLATAGMTLSFMRAVETIPLGTASALEFTGPLAVALVQGRGAGRWWALAAAAGVLGLTEPWSGSADLVGVLYALGGAVCWAAYVLLTQRAGDAVDGVGALSVSMPVAALAATLVVGPGVAGRLDLPVLAIGLGLALLLPVVPFCLELLALRRLAASAFGTLMCLEPAIAATVGVVFLHQVPSMAALAGLVLVIAAGIGAARTGRRDPAGAERELQPAAPARQPG